MVKIVGSETYCICFKCKAIKPYVGGHPKPCPECGYEAV